MFNKIDKEKKKTEGDVAAAGEKAELSLPISPELKKKEVSSLEPQEKALLGEVEGVPSEAAETGADFEERMEKLHVKGRKRGKRYSVFGIITIFVISLSAMIGGYFFLTEIIELTGRANEQDVLLTGYRVENRNSDVKDLKIIPEAWLRCEIDEDCVETKIDCCDCAVGGEQVAINTKFLTNWTNVLNKKCSEIDCDQGIKCLSGEPACSDGRCIFKSEYPDCIANGSIVNDDMIKASGEKVECCEGLIREKSYLSDLEYCGVCGDGVCDIFERAENCIADCSSDESLEWPTYKHEGLGLKFRYPSDWKVELSVLDISLYDDSDFKQEISIRKANNFNYNFSNLDFVLKREFGENELVFDYNLYRLKGKDGYFVYAFLSELKMYVFAEVNVNELELVSSMIVNIGQNIELLEEHEYGEWTVLQSEEFDLSFKYPSSWGGWLVSTVYMSGDSSKCEPKGSYRDFTFENRLDVFLGLYDRDISSCGSYLPAEYLLDSNGKLLDYEKIKNCDIRKEIKNEAFGFGLEIFNCENNDEGKIDYLGFDYVRSIGDEVKVYNFGHSYVRKMNNESPYSYFNVYYWLNSLGNVGGEVAGGEEMINMSIEENKRKLVSLDISDDDKEFMEDFYKFFSSFEFGVVSKDEGGDSVEPDYEVIEVVDEIEAIDENIDTDGDGLSDVDELKYGTDINVVDTDNDGFSDGDEVKGGYNPTGEGKL